jgi:hypothetical protein
MRAAGVWRSLPATERCWLSTRKGWRASARQGTLLLVLVALAGAVTPAAAQDPQSREHVVRRGETLWELARIYLSNPFLWPAIFEANRGSIRDPHWIYPDQRFVIPPVLAPGQTPLAERPPFPLLGEPADAVAVADPAAPAPQPPAPDLIAADLPPTLLEAQPARTLVRPAEYRAAPWLSPRGVAAVGNIARHADPASRGDRLSQTLQPYDRVHLGGLRASPAPGDSLLIVRVGGDVARGGRLVEPLGMVLVDSIVAGVPVATVVRQYGDAHVGDILIWPEAIPELPVATTADAPALGGTLVAFLDTRSLYGATEYGFVNIGRAQGLRIGDELVVHTPALPPSRRDPEGVPPVDVAHVRVIRVEDGSATVRVLNVTSTVLSAGMPVRRVRTAS